jgi:excisionase family DNA binding protein
MNSEALGQEILTVLNVHQGTLYKLVKEGRIPFFKIGSDWQFQKGQVVHWIAVQTTGAAQ